MTNEPKFRIGDTLLTHLNEQILIDDIQRAHDPFLDQYVYTYNAKSTDKWYEEINLRHVEKYSLQNKEQE